MKTRSTRILTVIAAAAIGGLAALPTMAANLLTKATDLPPLELSAGKAFPKEPIELEGGKYYRWTIKSDGTSESAVAAPEFFRFIWINEVVIDDIEVRPLGLDSIEFDHEGEATLSFIPIRAGTYEYFMPNAGDAFRGTIVVK
jgi:hypothetical protein